MIYIFYLWAGSTLYLILHYLFFHSRLVFYRGKERKPFRDGVSVIICAKNEAENLKKNLPSVLDQDFRKFEVIVVNDGSTDDTAAVLQEFKKKSRKLKLVTLPQGEADGKKSALVAGIVKSRNPYLLNTDADCEPASNNWLKGMASHFRTKEAVLGFSPYRPHGSVAGKLTQWETLLTAQQYFSFALSGLPYMGVGRNLGYAKGLFYNSDQFRKHAHLASGDDDLFIGQKATAITTVVEIKEDTFTWSDPPADLKKWWRQKRRHLTTARFYKFLPASLLGLFGLAQLLFYLLLIPLLLMGMSANIFVILLILKFAVQLVVLVPTARKLRQQEILWLFPVWELLTVVFLGIIHLQNLLNPKRTSWS